VDNLTHTIDILPPLLIGLGSRAVDFIGAVGSWRRMQFTLYGVTPMVQGVLLVGITVLLIMISARALGGLIRVAVILPLVLVPIQLVLPAFQY
jgi:hypothetical protein